MDSTQGTTSIHPLPLPHRILVVSNRLPYQITVRRRKPVTKRGIGGLVTAVEPVLRLAGGTWIGWSGSYGSLPDRVTIEPGANTGAAREFQLRLVHLTRDEIENYYLGYANKRLWPLFHYFQQHCEFNLQHWKTYQKVNRKFADVIVREYKSGDLIWIHDYHLLLVPALVRAKIPDARIAFFLHIPFPTEAIFAILPHAHDLLQGMLGSDLIGFHLPIYAEHFLNTVRLMTTCRFNRLGRSVIVEDRQVKVGSFPISIDFDYFNRLGSDQDVLAAARRLREYYPVRTLAFGADRLDYTKGILERLKALEIMLEKHPNLHGKFTFVQLSAPSRTKVKQYQRMRHEIEHLVGHIAGRFSKAGWVPVVYSYAGLPQSDLAAYYRAADIALITPLRDGLNLIAKEYVATHTDEDGVLVLSHLAGAAEELTDAVLVNPYDLEGMAEAIYGATQMRKKERQARMRRLREQVRHNDIYWWLEQFLRAVPP